MVSTYSMFVLPPGLQLENKTLFLSSSGCLLLSYNLCSQCARLLLPQGTKSAVAQWRSEIAVIATHITHPYSWNVSKRMLRWYFTHFQEERYRCVHLTAEFARSNDREGTPCWTLPLDFCYEENTSFIFYMPQPHTKLLYTGSICTLLTALKSHPVLLSAHLKQHLWSAKLLNSM